MIDLSKKNLLSMVVGLLFISSTAVFFIEPDQGQCANPLSDCGSGTWTSLQWETYDDDIGDRYGHLPTWSEIGVDCPYDCASVDGYITTYSNTIVPLPPKGDNSDPCYYFNWYSCTLSWAGPNVYEKGGLGCEDVKTVTIDWTCNCPPPTATPSPTPTPTPYPIFLPLVTK